MVAKKTPRGDRRYWVWVTGPDYYLDEDGSERQDLDPGQGYEPGGWWTCHRETEEGDLVLVYRSQKKKDLAYLIETRSAAYSLLDDDHAAERGWDYGCDFEVIEKFQVRVGEIPWRFESSHPHRAQSPAPGRTGRP